MKIKEEKDLLVNPTVEQVEDRIKAACDGANYRARQRTVRASELNYDPSTPQGSDYANGGDVANRYGYTTGTSVVGVAWWTSGKGIRYVRVEGYRKSISGRCNPKPWSGDNDYAKVFPNRHRDLWTALVERCKRAIERRGPRGEDDRLSIIAPVLSAVSKEGILISDDRRQMAAVVVTDSTTGLRHAINVPPKFVRPDSKTYQKLGSSAARVHAAIAWTFGLKPEKYNPQIAA